MGGLIRKSPEMYVFYSPSQFCTEKKGARWAMLEKKKNAEVEKLDLRKQRTHTLR